MGSPINGFSQTPKPPPSSTLSTQIPLHQFQNSNPHPLIHNRNLPDDFFDHMLSAIPSWPDLAADKRVTGDDGFQFAAPYDESSLLAARLWQQRIGPQQQQHNQLLLSAISDSDSSFKSPCSTGVGFKGSQLQHLHQPPQGASIPRQSFGGSPPKVMYSPAIAAGGGAAGGAPPRQRVRARRGQATDPHSIAERLRRERIAERMKALQELVPNANKTDKASMLDEIIDYVKFLQLQVKVLSMSRLGGAAAISPLIADIPSEGRGLAAATSETISATENCVAKLMKEDMGSAMQYLQGKGLCLMPISLASAISTVTSTSAAAGLLTAGRVVPMIPAVGDAPPPSPSMSVLTVQSAVAGTGGDACVSRSRSSGKDAA